MAELDVARIEKRKIILDELNKVFEKRFKDEEWLQQRSEIYQEKAKEIDKKMFKSWRGSYFKFVR